MNIPIQAINLLQESKKNRFSTFPCPWHDWQYSRTSATLLQHSRLKNSDAAKPRYRRRNVYHSPDVLFGGITWRTGREPEYQARQRQ